ncbi:MAG: biopolymer transporter ExbD [Deltaproteobacteria bacterium]|nr:biopolymer transporter ExbD [Deltaproteobacteria bacterium]
MNLNYDPSSRPIADMNLTPLIDVMMVLMIIFMVTSPVEPAGINLELPETKGAPVPGNRDKLTIFMGFDEKVVLTMGEGKRIETDLNGLEGTLKSAFPGTNEANVRADKNLKYQKVMELLVAVRKAGIKGIGLMTSTKPDGEKK